MTVEDLAARIPEGTIRYFATGAAGGDPLLLIHSLGTSRFIWEECLPMFADLGYRAVAPDILGHGDSDKPPYFGYGIRDHAASLIAFMRAIGFRKPFIAGTSLGAQIAIEIGAGYPTVPRKLALNGCPGWEFEEQRMARIQMIAQTRLDEDGLPRPMERGADRLRSGIPRDEKKVRQLNEDLGKCGRWFWDTAWATAAYNLHDRLAGITCPVLVLMGETDFHLPTSYTLVHKIPNARMQVLPAPIGHISPLDDPGAVVRACDEFFRAPDDPLEG